MKIAIHTVFILKENILFLEEWINYHILLGFNKFYLYDNSKVNKITGWDTRHSKTIIFGKINKYNINYGELVNMDDNQMNEYLQKICDKYKCIEIIEWSPTDAGGRILYNQSDAHRDCFEKLKNDNIDWCAYIDMDEYIVMSKYDNIENYLFSLRPEINNVKMGQLRFETRFYNLDKLITNITKSEIKTIARHESNKNIFKVINTKSPNIHSVALNCGREHIPSIHEICINHYKLKEGEYKEIDNIHPNIKSQLNKETFISIN